MTDIHGMNSEQFAAYLKSLADDHDSASRPYQADTYREAAARIHQLHNDHLVDFTNQLTLKDLQFILLVWKDRISIWNPNTRQQDSVDDVWINGTAVELGVPQEEK